MESNSGEVLFDIRHVSHTFETEEGKTFDALKDVTAQIKKGEFTAIIGSSGSGKSTLLHIIAGVDIPTSGTVFLNGQDVYAQNRQQLAIFRRRQVGIDRKSVV